MNSQITRRLLVSLGLAVAGAHAARFLQQVYHPVEDMNQTTSSGYSQYYGTANVSISYDQNLGCGACIRAGYIYCVPGGSAQWGGRLQPVCCQNAANCAQISNTANYNCSSQWASPILAMQVCPF